MIQFSTKAFLSQRKAMTADVGLPHLDRLAASPSRVILRHCRCSRTISLNPPSLLSTNYLHGPIFLLAITHGCHLCLVDPSVTDLDAAMLSAPSPVCLPFLAIFPGIPSSFSSLSQKALLWPFFSSVLSVRGVMYRMCIVCLVNVPDFQTKQR